MLRSAVTTEVSCDVTTVRTHCTPAALRHSAIMDGGVMLHTCSSTQLAVRRIIALRLTEHHVCDMERTSAFKHH